jgi:succinate dehydrogenase hydrophobic anchor subunit
MKIGEGLAVGCGAIILVALVICIASLPATWLAWFALGLFGVKVGFWKLWVALLAVMFVLHAVIPNRKVTIKD